MKIRFEMECDALTGHYDVRYYNIDHPNDLVPMHTLQSLMSRVLQHMQQKQSAPLPKLAAVTELKNKLDWN